MFLDIIKSVEGSSNGGFWLGATNMLGEVWKNLRDGSNVTFFNWAPGSPQNGLYPLCAYLQKDGLWRSDYCHKSYYYVCGFPEDDKITKPFNAA